MNILLIIFWVLLFGSGATWIFQRHRPGLAGPAAAGLISLGLLSWLFLRNQLPLEAVFLSWSSGEILPAWSWQISLTTWSLTAWLLLLAAAVSWHAVLTKPSSTDRPEFFAFLPLLTAAALTFVWSDTFTGLLAGMTMLLLIWVAYFWQAEGGNEAFLFKGAVLLLALMLSWPIGSSRTTLLAAALLLNIWPLPLWQPRNVVASGVYLFAYLLPPLAGGLLLLRLLPVSQLSPGLSLLLTVLSLVGFLQCVRLAWGRLHLPGYAVTALILAQAHLLLLAAIWVGTPGLVAELRVLLLAGGTLYLVATQPYRQRLLRLFSGGLALAALAGLPLTAGFAGRAGLYAAWIADGRWPLVLVTALLHLPLVMGGVWLLQANSPTPPLEEASLKDWLREGLPFAPALGLLSLSNVIWSAVPAGAWAAILGSAVLGIILPRVLGDAQPVRVALRQALGAERPLMSKVPSWRELGFGGQTAVNDAADILDGDSGLLWLLLLAVIIILAG